MTHFSTHLTWWILFTIFLWGVFFVGWNTLATSSDFTSDIEACIEARRTGNEASITEYVCPSGEMISTPGGPAPLTDENIAYMVAQNKMFIELDKSVNEKIEKYDTARSTDPASWTEAYGQDFDPARPTSTYPEKYMTVCNTKAKEAVIAWSKATGKPLSTYSLLSEYLTGSTLSCGDLVDRKMYAFRMQSSMVATNNTAKVGENALRTTMNGPSESSELSGVKWAYLRVLEMLRLYVAALTKSVDKMDKFVTTPSIAPR